MLCLNSENLIPLCTVEDKQVLHFLKIYLIELNQYSVIKHQQSIIKEKDTSRKARTTAEVKKGKL